MKKIAIKTVDALNAYNVLNVSKFGELESNDMVRAWHLIRALQPIAVKYEEECRDAFDKLKPNDKDFDDKLQKFYDYNGMVRDPKADMKKLPMGVAEYEDFRKNVWEPYQARVAKALEKFATKMNDLEVETISDDAFGKLIVSNNWTGSQIMTVSELLTD